MGNIFAVVSKAVFEKSAKGLGVGDVYETDRYDSNPAAFGPALKGGGTIYMVTARPGDQLWLIAKIEAPKLKAGKWVGKANTTPITDLTAVIPKLKFASGNGIHAKPGQLGMSLQTPRELAAEDLALLGGSKMKKTVSDEDDAIVRADAMSEQGDPRGELVQVQARLAKSPKDKKLRAHEQKLLKDPALIGPLAPWAKKLTWKLGFVDTAKVDKAKRSELEAIVAHPSMRNVTSLEIEASFEGVAGVILAMAKQAWPKLTSLAITQDKMEFAPRTDDDEDREPIYSTEYEEHDHKAGDKLWKMMPALTKLTIDGWNLFHTIDLPKLEDLSLVGIPVCTIKAPKLGKLAYRIDEDDTGTGVDWSPDAISVIWKSNLPALFELDLDDCGSVSTIEENDGDDDDEDTSLAAALLRNKKFVTLAKQLDKLRLPYGQWMYKAKITKWLAT
ncbi:MAG: hypothetical protein QM831_13180 [Kofleriaceae bacterium]